VQHPLQLSNVTKRFGSFTAVHDVSFSLPSGQIVGFLGPNGAGKSTSLRLALGIMSPDRGEIDLFGGPPSLSALRRVGFLPEERGLYKKMTARNVIAYFGRLKGLSQSDALVRADALLERFGLAEFRKTRISRLSKGMAQKVQILSTFVHEPDVLILDEPFSGLDPVNQSELEQLIREQHARGTTILFSTHVMEHAERLCDSLILISHGRKLFEGNLAQAYATQDQHVRIASSMNTDLTSTFSDSAYAIQRLPLDDETSDRVWWLITLPNGASAQDALKRAIEAGIPIEGFDPGEQRLRDVFVSLVSQAEAEFGGRRHG
tara:strand:+ start:29111 stop:30067 length:957 start_codon:yes stop_codon:yes gene_type:complete